MLRDDDGGTRCTGRRLDRDLEGVAGEGGGDRVDHFRPDRDVDAFGGGRAAGGRDREPEIRRGLPAAFATEIAVGALVAANLQAQIARFCCYSMQPKLCPTK